MEWPKILYLNRVGHLPLLTGLVGLRVGGQMVSELATSYNLGWAAASVPKRSVPVVKHDLFRQEQEQS